MEEIMMMLLKMEKDRQQIINKMNENRKEDKEEIKQFVREEEMMQIRKWKKDRKKTRVV